MSQLFNTFFYQPLFNALVFIYNIIPGHDIGLTIIVLTFIIKLILYPLSIKSIKSQKSLQELQPKIDAIKNQYKDQKDKQASEMMRLYKDEKVSPFSSCLPLLVQLPFLIAVYWVFQNGLTKGDSGMVYGFIFNPGKLNTMAFGFLDLAKANYVLAVLAGALQFVQAKMMPMQKPAVKTDGSKDENMMVEMNKQMLYFMPIMTVVIGFGLPGGLMLYWAANSLFTIFQQMIAFKKKKDVTIVDSSIVVEKK